MLESKSGAEIDVVIEVDCETKVGNEVLKQTRGCMCSWSQIRVLECLTEENLCKRVAWRLLTDGETGGNELELV